MSNDTTAGGWRERLPWGYTGPVLGTLGALVLGGVLLFSAWAKALDPLGFARQIETEGLDFLFSARAVAFLALALEIALGAALVLGMRRLWVLVPAALLVAFFLFLTGRAYWDFAHGIVREDESCGCFGNLVERTPAEAFWQDVFLLVPGLALAFLGRTGKAFPRVRFAVVAALTLVGVAFAVKSPDLPLDDLATRLKPGKLVGEICTGQDEDRICMTHLVPQLQEGEALVLLADLEDPALGAAVDALNAYVLGGASPQLYVLSAATDDARHRFFWEWGPAFEIHEAPPALLRPLYRRLPRSFRIEAGEVVETFAGFPPAIAPRESTTSDDT